MIAIEKNITLTRKDEHTFKKFSFYVEEDSKILLVNFSYTPKFFYDDEVSKMILRKNLARYDENKVYSDGELKKYLPLKNFITISIDSPNGYIGSAHRSPNKQKIFISKTESSNGFLKTDIAKGNWNVVLASQLIVSPSIDVVIEVIYE